VTGVATAGSRLVRIIPTVPHLVLVDDDGLHQSIRPRQRTIGGGLVGAGSGTAIGAAAGGGDGAALGAAVGRAAGAAEDLSLCHHHRHTTTRGAIRREATSRGARSCGIREAVIEFVIGQAFDLTNYRRGDA
jgi:uncharacterized protein YcfJ